MFAIRLLWWIIIYLFMLLQSESVNVFTQFGHHLGSRDSSRIARPNTGIRTTGWIPHAHVVHGIHRQHHDWQWSGGIVGISIRQGFRCPYDEWSRIRACFARTFSDAGCTCENVASNTGLFGWNRHWQAMCPARVDTQQGRACSCDRHRRVCRASQ